MGVLILIAVVFVAVVFLGFAFVFTVWQAFGAILIFLAVMFLCFLFWKMVLTRPIDPQDLNLTPVVYGFWTAVVITSFLLYWGFNSPLHRWWTFNTPLMGGSGARDAKLSNVVFGNKVEEWETEQQNRQCKGQRALHPYSGRFKGENINYIRCFCTSNTGCYPDEVCMPGSVFPDNRSMCVPNL